MPGVRSDPIDFLTPLRRQSQASPVHLQQACPCFMFECVWNEELKTRSTLVILDLLLYVLNSIRVLNGAVSHTIQHIILQAFL